MEETLKIPRERIAVLIGKEGKVKKKIEKACNVKLDIDSASGSVSVESGDGNAINFYNALNIIKAIARGFSPENAFLLLQDDMLLRLLELPDLVGKSEKQQTEKKGRVIGRHGMARQQIEDETGCKISVYGKTIAVIGKPEELERAIKAITMLVGGANHKTIFDYLRKKQAGEGKFEL